MKHQGVQMKTSLSFLPPPHLGSSLFPSGASAPQDFSGSGVGQRLGAGWGVSLGIATA